LFVGVRCPIETIMERRRTTGWETATPVGAPVRLWQREVHIPGIYDLEVDTTVLGPETRAAVIRRHLDHGPPPSAFRQLAAMTTGSSFLTGSFSSPAQWTPAGASAILADSPSLGSV
jgi:chloramphenicol 3-O phosphotransferase